MQITDFITNYNIGINFKKLLLTDDNYRAIKFPEDFNHNGGYLYLLVVDNEIVYIGQSTNIKYRLRLHREKMIIDEIWIAQIISNYEDNAFNLLLSEERDAITFAKPILNNKGFMVFENRESKSKIGYKPDINFVLGYIRCLEKNK